MRDPSEIFPPLHVKTRKMASSDQRLSTTTISIVESLISRSELQRRLERLRMMAAKVENVQGGSSLYGL